MQTHVPFSEKQSAEVEQDTKLVGENCTGSQSQGLTSEFLTGQQAARVLFAPLLTPTAASSPRGGRDRRWILAQQEDHQPVGWAFEAWKTALQTASVTAFPACLKMKVQQRDQASYLKISTGTFPWLLPFEII